MQFPMLFGAAVKIPGSLVLGMEWDSEILLNHFPELTHWFLTPCMVHESLLLVNSYLQHSLR